MNKIDIEDINKITKLVTNYKKIPIGEFTPTETEKSRLVVWILNRQKPSVEPDYSFDEERLGITHEGKIIFGFDSGCSCPSPWYDCGDSVYTEKTWKEITDVDLQAFEGFEVEDTKNLDRLLSLIQ